MTKDAAVAALKAHLAAHGFGDIEVNVSGGYDPTSTVASARLIQAQIAVLKRAGIEVDAGDATRRGNSRVGAIVNYLLGGGGERGGQMVRQWE